MADELRVSGTITPNIPELPTHIDTFGRGGYRAVNEYYELGELIQNGTHVTPGMVVYVQDNNTTYMFDGTNFNPVYMFGTNNISSPSNNHTIVYNTTTAQWESKKINGGVIEPLSITDAHIAGGEINFSKFAWNTGLRLVNFTFLNHQQSPVVMTELGIGLPFGDDGALGYFQITNHDNTPSTVSDIVFGNTLSDNLGVTGGVGGVSVMSQEGIGYVISKISDTGNIYWKNDSGIAASMTIKLIAYMNFNPII